jgi:hypothetical protein
MVYKDIHYDKLVRVTNDKGEVVREVPTWGNSTMDWKDMKDQYPSEVIGSAAAGLKTVIIVPESHAELITTVHMKRKSPMMCLYDSIEDYCKNILGVNFSNEDKTFFEEHPAVQEDGVPFPDTLRVAQELVGPYGLRVSRVQIAPNYGVKGDILQWRKVLGCNPLAYGDRMTSNEQFREQFPKDTTDYRFEYVKGALFPAIACGVIYGGETSGATGSTGGHAVYLPPRRRAQGALMSFQIDRANAAVWKTSPIIPAYEASNNSKSLEVFDLDAWYRSTFREKRSQTGSGTVYSVANSRLVPVRTESQNTTKPQCWKCKRKDEIRKHTYGYPGICDDCWDTFISKVDCSTMICQKNLTIPAPHLRLHMFHPNSRSIYISCPNCHKFYRIEYDKTDKQGRNMIRTIELYMMDMKMKHYTVRSTTQTEVTPPNDAVPSSD